MFVPGGINCRSTWILFAVSILLLSLGFIFYQSRHVQAEPAPPKKAPMHDPR
ncbi:MAG TPA: hypothetical protein VFA68_08765 [Terriglobales bacterium]|nr:hypothetical protein [Terriglobales bacterium]